MINEDENCSTNEIYIQWNQDGPQGEQGRVGPSTATMAFNPVPTMNNITITNITINGSSITSPILPGSTVQVELDYFSNFLYWFLTCWQQLVFGFASDETPTVCIFSDMSFLPMGEHASFTLTTPDTPGTEYIAFYRHLGYTCEDALNTPWSVAPNQYIGVVAIH